MGVVYLAEHALIEKKIALKVLFPDLTRRTDLVARFLQEAKSASRIGHENVIDITDFGQSPEGYVFIAMEYLSGQDLGQVLKASGAMPWPRAQPILLQIVKALRAAHEARHHPPRHEAGERLPHPARRAPGLRQGAGLRHRQGVWASTRTARA